MKNTDESWKKLIRNCELAVLCFALKIFCIAAFVHFLLITYLNKAEVDHCSKEMAWLGRRVKGDCKADCLLMKQSSGLWRAEILK